LSQHDLSIANQGFPAFRSDLNDALQALGTQSSGATAPSTTFANMLWYDTANNIIKMRNEDNDAWISLLTLDQSSDIVSAVAATLATFVTLSITGNATIGADSTNTFNVGNGGIVKDASGNVGIGTSSPTEKLDVNGTVKATTFSGSASGLTGIPAPSALTTASGSAPSYSARAWVNFNGTGTVAIRGSGNVSSITDNGVGIYTVNFTNAMPDVNYSAVASGGKYSGGNDGNNSVAVGSATTPPATTSCQIANFTSTVGTTDNPNIFFAAFR
jgi:hypothetical protein